MSEKMFVSQAPGREKAKEQKADWIPYKWDSFGKDLEENIRVMQRKAQKENKTVFTELDDVKIIIPPYSLKNESIEELVTFYEKKLDKSLERHVEQGKKEQRESAPAWKRAKHKAEMEFPTIVAEERRKNREFRQALRELNFNDPQTVLNWCLGFLETWTANVEEFNKKEIISIFKAKGFSSTLEKASVTGGKKGEREYRNIIASILDALKTDPPLAWQTYVQVDIKNWEKKFGEKKKEK